MKLKYLTQFTITSSVLTTEDIDRVLDIDKVDHHVILVDHHHNSTVLSPVTIVKIIVLPIIFMSFIYILSRTISFVNKADDIRINEVKCFAFMIIEISI